MTKKNYKNKVTFKPLWKWMICLFMMTGFFGPKVLAQTTFNFTGSVVTYTVPAGVFNISIDAKGAEGGIQPESNAFGPGKGARMVGVISVTPGQQLKVLVGGQPATAGSDEGAGGGGGSFVTTTADVALVIAGGGGGEGADAAGVNASVTTSGTTANIGGVGGINGNGGGFQAVSTANGSGGGGLLTDGLEACAGGRGRAFIIGAAGGISCGGTGSAGGFGCGGGGSSEGAGGGGGYSGGGGADGGGSDGGGGGGSYVSGLTQIATAGFQSGNGQIIITELTTPCVAPTNQPTSLVLTPAASFQINGSFTAASGSDSYLIVRYATGASPSLLPVDGNFYAPGVALGNGTVVSTTTSTSFSATGLTLSTTYDFYVYSMNSVCGGGPLYLTTAPLTGTSTTPAGSSATSIGGLWSSAATWVSGAVPPTTETVIIPSGAIVTVDQLVTAANLSISGVVQWNGTSNAMTITGNLTVNSGGSFLPYTTGQTGQTVNIGGNFINNGYTNCAVASTFINFNGSGSNLGGSGVFQGDGVKGLIRTLAFQNLGSNSITTSQDLVAVSGFTHTAGSLNTNGKLTIDNTAQVYGLPLNKQVANVAVTTMGSLYTVAPVVFGGSISQWTNITGVVGTRYVSGSNVYVCTTAANIGPAAPSHTSGISQNLLWIGTVGTIGTPCVFNAGVTLGTQYFYGNNLYVCIVAGTPSSAAPPVHTSGTAVSGGATFLYVGSPATVTVNYDGASQTVRSLNLTSPGSGLSGAPAISFAVGVAGGTGSGAVATAVYIQQVAGIANSLTQKSGGATITGGMTINSDQGVTPTLSTDELASSGVGNISTTGGGVNYTVAPVIGFAGPTQLNLVTNAGSGYITAPTVTVTGGNLVSGSALTSSNFLISVFQGRVVWVSLATATTACYSTPPSLTLTASPGVTATLAFPAGCWPSATANIGSNGQLLSFTMTNSGFGYVAAPTVGIGTGSGTANGGTYTTIAATPTSRIALYTLTLNLFTPSAIATAQPDNGTVIPVNRKMQALNLNGNGNGITLSSNLTLFGTTPLALVASLSVPGNILDLGGNNLLFANNAYAGLTGSTFNSAGTNAYIKNGSISMTGRAGASVFNFPFAGNTTTGGLVWSAGSTPTAVTTGNTATKVTISELGAPTNASFGTGAAIGNRSYRVQLNAGAVTGLNPTITPHFNSLDGLTTLQNNTYVAEATAQSGPWTIRSTSYGATAVALPAVGSKATATTAPGPITAGVDQYYAFAQIATAITSFNPTNSCGGGSVVITGSGFTGATAVSFGGTPALSFVVNSSTQITAVVSNTGSTGTVSVTSPSGTGTSAGTFTFDGVGPVVSIQEGSTVTICTGGSTTLTALPTGSGETYLWSANAGSATTQQVTVNTAGTYSCTVTNTGGCANVTSATVVISVVPPLTVTGTPSTMCSGSSAVLNGTAIIGAPGTATVGTSTTTIGGNDGNPYRSGNGTGNQIKVQMLYTVAELTAAGITAGPITSLGFTTTSASSGTISNFEIRIGSTNVTALTTTFQTSATTLVFNTASFTPLSAGLNTHIFNQGTFTWDGVSNILVQTCQTNNISGTATVQAYTPAFLSNTSMQTSATSCSSLTGTTPAAKPIITFGAVVGTNIAGSLTWVWQPGNLTGIPQTVSPLSTTNYTVTATDAFGCTNTGSVSVTVNTTPSAPTISGGLAVCGQATTTLTSSAPTGGNTINWYDAPTGGTLVNTGTSFVTPILTASKTYYVQETAGPCASTRTAVTVTWTAAPALAIFNTTNNNTNDVSFCGTSSVPVVNLDATSASASSWAANGSTYSWSESHPGGLSCAGTCTATNSVDLNNIIPAFNNEHIVLTVTDPVLNCVSSSTVDITAFTFPAFNAAATPASVCMGQSTSLSAGVSASNFAVSSITYGGMAVPGSGVTTLSSGGANIVTPSTISIALDDQIWGSQPIGFNFNFFGNVYSTVNISSNGNLQFTTSNTTFTPGALPNATVLNFIAPFWTDLYLALPATPGFGIIRYWTTGFSPNRIFVCDFTNVGHYNSGTTPTAHFTGQVWMYETTGLVETHIGSVTGNGSPNTYTWSTGVNNLTGTIGAAAPNRNNNQAGAFLNATNEGWRFTPPINYSFAWTSVPAGFTSSSGTPTATPTVNTAYSVLITDPVTGCTKTDNVSVTVEALPTVNISPSTSNICSPGGTAATLTASGTGPAATYSWTPAAGLTPATGAVVSALPSISTVYTVTATTVAGCTATATSTVSVTAGPDVTVTATPPTVCAGSNSQLNATVVTTGYNMNINCSTGFIDISGTGVSIGAIGDDTEHPITIPSFNFNGINYTTAVVGMNGVIVLGVSSGDITLTNGTLPTTTITAGNVFLAPYWDDLDVNLGATVVTQTVGNVFIIQWTNTDHNLFTTGGITFQVQMNLLTGVITFVYPDATFGDPGFDFGVTGTIGIQMSSTSALQYSFDMASLVNGQCISFAPAIPNLTFNWSANPTYLSATNIANPVAQNALVSQSYSVIVTDLNTGCANTQTLPLTVNDLPDLSTSGGGVACEGNGISLSVSNNAAGQSSGNSYLWTTDASIPFTSTQQTPNVTGSSVAGHSGNYTVVVTNSFLCTASAIEAVTVNPNPTLSIVSVQNVGCVGGSDGVITVSASNGTPNYDYSADGFTTQNNTGVMTNLPTGPTTIVVLDANGCTGSITQSLTAISTVPPSAAVVVPFIGMPTNVCNGTTATLSIPAVSNTTMYIWDAPGAAYFNGNPLNVSPFTTSTPSVTVTYSTPGGSLYVTGVQAANGCGASLRKVQKTRGTISVPAIVSGSTTACANTTGTYSTGAVDAASSYQWTITGDATVSGTGTTATVTFGPAWNGGTLCVAAQTSCYTSPAKCITLSKSASTLNAISGAFTACPNTTLSYSVPPSTGAASYTWTLPAGSTGSSTTNSISVTYGPGYSAAGSICVSVTSVCGVTSAIKCKTVAPGLPGQPSSITGALTGLCNQTVAYSCPSQGAGVTYNWTSPGSITSGQGSTSISTTFAALSTGNVCVTASNSCGSSLARCVPVKGAPNAPGAITATPSSWCANTPGIEFNVSTGSLTGSYTLSWAYPNASVVTYAFGGGNSTSLILDWISGSGAVNVTASNACGGATKPSTWSSTCREGETGTVSSMTVSPNPTTGVVNVNYTATKGSTVINVLDLAGRVVMTQATSSVEGVNTTQLDMSKLAKGAYMLSVQSTQGNKQIKVVVE